MGRALCWLAEYRQLPDATESQLAAEASQGTPVGDNYAFR